jgi:uncharacterized protein (DUF2062 family)
MALGVFVGCTPAIGLHGWIALAAATVLRLNRLWAFLGSRVCTLLVLPWITLTELEVAHRIRTGEWLPLRVSTVLHDAHGLLADWLLGTVLVGGALALAIGLLAYGIARRLHSVATPPQADIAPSLDHARGHVEHREP